MNNPIKYSNCWEDAFLLGKALDIHAESKIMSVASGGDNSLYLARFHPEKILCIDLNEVQLFITQLKESAIRLFDRSTFLEFSGFVPCKNRLRYYEMIKSDLPKEAQEYFDTHSVLIEKGIIHQGKFEKYFRLFSGKILPLIHSRKRINQLFEEKPDEAQKLFYQKKWNTMRWRWLFKVFFSKRVMGKLGREPEKMNYVEGSVSEKIFAQTSAHLSSVHCQSNYILEYALTGKFQKNLPAYVLEDAFAAVKKWLQNHRIQYEYLPLGEALKKHTDYDRFNLSNIFEYMDADTFKYNIEMLTKYSAPQSIAAYWNLMVPRKIEYKTWRQKAVKHPDSGFFYQQFYTFKK